jgi:hypothetical protein
VENAGYHCQEAESVTMYTVRIIMKVMETWQCFESGWILVDLALLDPDPYWECGSGSISKETDKNYK